jgi:hypothetical protein
VKNEIEPQPQRRAISKKCDRLLSNVRANPQGDWQIKDFERICENVGVSCSAPTRGSHYKISSDFIADVVLTIPACKPIKAPYVRQFVRLIDAHIESCVKGGER